MKPSPPTRYPHRVTWSVFIVLLLFAILFVTGTASELPLTVASHFDAAGQPNAFMSRSGYTRFVLCLVVGLPVIVVIILTTVYSRASDLKLPNREYWLAPQRLDRTRSFLVAHGVWFGSLLVTLVCFEPPATAASVESDVRRGPDRVSYRNGGMGRRTHVRLSPTRGRIVTFFICAIPP